MKTAEEIRRHRDDLIFCADTVKNPCGCNGTDHAVECVLGRKYMQVSITLLSWVLGEDRDYQHGPVDSMRNSVYEGTGQ